MIEQIGPYRVLEKLGEGGMGEVYRARDVRLNRQVALKVLPDAVAGDSERVARLRREAQVLASLNHPHIAALHGIEDAGATLALVMELVEGVDLRQQLARGPIPLDEALKIARQIALGLEAAHAQGIVHRDLKPANIKVRADGTVKLLDFGLARAERDVVPSDASPTITSPAALTAVGVVLGTAAYMSPEQARGYPADKRSDIWAFGGVLFEMLTGRCAFPGATVTDTLASVMRAEPDWRALPADTPAGIRLLLRRCLEKDADRRLHDIADARLEIDDASSGAREPAAIAAPPARERKLLTAGAALVVLTLAALGGWFLRTSPDQPETRLELTTPATTDAAFALSPDGRKVVFVAPDGGQMKLWIRSLDDGVARPLPRTEGATFPFWSPDGKSLGFFGKAKLNRVDIDGGNVKSLVPGVAVPLGGSWSADGTILFAENPGGPIRRVPANGGDVVDVTTVAVPGERGHSFPQFLPGGRRFLFVMSGNSETRGVYVGDLDGGQKKRLLDASGTAVYVAPGYLVFARGKQLLAQRFDAESATLSGDVMTIGELGGATTRLSASAAGTVAYRTQPGDSGQRQLVWIDRSGRELERVVYAGSAAQGPALSHDGRFVAVFRFIDGNMDLWSYDRKRQLWDRLTRDPGDDIYPLWSTDDRRIIYAAMRRGTRLGLYQRVLSAPPESEEPLLKAPGGEFAMDWSSDGKHVLFTRYSPTRGVDIWALAVDDRTAEPFEMVATDANEGLAQFSPDGKWIAYESDRSGTEEIYIRPFSGPGPDVRVSAEGGIQARWNRNGRELFYLGGDDWLRSVPVAFKPDGTLDVGRADKLFATTIGSTVRLRYRQQYSVSADGQSFMINSAVDVPAPGPIELIMNWKPGR
jgi:Tol biopolymer transport system component